MSYAPISTSDQTLPSISATTSTLNENLNRSPHTPQSTQSTSFTHIPAACLLSWTDQFYQGKHGIVAVLDRDSFRAGQFQFWTFMRFAAIFILFACLYFLLGKWVQPQDSELAILDDVQAVYFCGISLLFLAMAYRADLQQKQQHVAVTTEGIRIDHGTTMTVIIPFENIHQIQAHHSVKYACGLAQNSNLTRVSVVRSLAPLEQICFRKTRNLELYGILQAQQFVDLVEAMKDSFQHGTYEGADMVGTEMVVSYRPQPPSQQQVQQQQVQQQQVQQTTLQTPQQFVQPQQPAHHHQNDQDAAVFRF